MTIDHLAIFTPCIEKLISYYTRYFDAVPGSFYINEKKKFRSCFLSFESGARIEIMEMEGIPDNANDTLVKQHKGLVHLAFGAENPGRVNDLARQLEQDGYRIIDGPRITGDGYYEFVTFDPDGNRLEVCSKHTSPG